MSIEQEIQKNKKISKQPKTKKQVWMVMRTVLIAAVLGIFAGAIGALLAFNYLSDYLSNILSPAPVTSVSPAARVVSPGTFESAVETAQEKVVPAMVTFYRAKQGGEPSDSIYFDNDVLGYGLIFTSDGWLITTADVFGQLADAQVTVRAGNDFYEVENSLADEASGAMFVKIDGENLPVVQISEDRFIESGDRLLVVWGGGNFASANLVNKRHLKIGPGNYLKDSETVESRLLLSSGACEDSAVIVNYTGEVVGIVWEAAEEGTIGLPLKLLNPLMRSLLKEGSFVRPNFGVRYIDLAQAPGLGNELTMGNPRGALIWPGPGGSPAAIEEGSPAEGAGLIEGDIILSVNGQALNGHGNLSELLLDYAPGDRLNLEVMRDNETININLSLGSQNDV